MFLRECLLLSLYSARACIPQLVKPACSPARRRAVCGTDLVIRFCGLRFSQVPLAEVTLTCPALSPVPSGVNSLLVTVLLLQSGMGLAEMGDMGVCFSSSLRSGSSWRKVLLRWKQKLHAGGVCGAPLTRRKAVDDGVYVWQWCEGPAFGSRPSGSWAKCSSVAFQRQDMLQSETMLVWRLVCFLVVPACNEYLTVCCEQVNVGRWTAVVRTQEAFWAGDYRV